ncbi:hypothetical protein [Ornithinibacillus xuwenensis]|uniref:Uncharacterized protein n=1 Tax=Ornithinibacillus xuwenensis TaxID=3144668 RepID=A0ABU9XGW2_9BACI
MKLDGNQILDLGKKHKKWNENVTVEIFPYLLNNHRFYLAYYHGKFNRNVKSIAVVSPDANCKEEALKALEPLVFFTITFDKVENNTKARAELDYSIYEEIRVYLKNVLESNVLKDSLSEIYQRSYNIIDEMINLQKEMLNLRQKVNAFASSVLDRGYFLHDEIDELFEVFPIPGWIQYKQFYDRYQFRSDFDVIYENSSKPELQSFMRFRDSNTLKNMTSAVAEKQLADSLEVLTDGKDMSSLTEEEYQQYWLSKFKNDLYERYQQLRDQLRYP